MNQVEELIIRFYSKYSFMYDKLDSKNQDQDEKQKFFMTLQTAIMDEMQMNLSVPDIEAKWKYLKDSFNRVDKKIIEGNVALTHWDKNIYEKLFFLKPFITHRPNAVVSKKKCNNVKPKASAVLEKLKHNNERVFAYDLQMKMKKCAEKSSRRAALNDINSSINQNNFIDKRKSCLLINNVINAFPTSTMQEAALQLVLDTISSFTSNLNQN
ncbi:hypothetical protein TKK_0019083 [Trichogramma kaykai]|uniref:MADF domain-containing protein n=1 Tax=Trichogramma kaykai TaxID=54128 RepID=A0ABD2VUK2_9HYME